ncbi:MAG: hypothetical protein HC767_00435 [Akkermansiaceae bacterium]|nr:hypothetical protein [Akkermansiaceae bacterium]
MTVGKTRKKTFTIKNVGTDALGNISISMKKNSSFRLKKSSKIEPQAR